jgi:hypothetical protein
MCLHFPTCQTAVVFNRTNISCRVTPVVFEAFLLALTLHKCVQSLRRHRTPIIALLVRDGTWAFLAIFRMYNLTALTYSVFEIMLTSLSVVFILNGICFLSMQDARSAILYAWLYTVSAIVSTRLILNLHHVSHHSSLRAQSTNTTHMDHFEEDVTAVELETRATKGKWKWKGKDQDLSTRISDANSSSRISALDLELGFATPSRSAAPSLPARSPSFRRHLHPPSTLDPSSPIWHPRLDTQDAQTHVQPGVCYMPLSPQCLDEDLELDVDGDFDFAPPPPVRVCDRPAPTPGSSSPPASRSSTMTAPNQYDIPGAIVPAPLQANPFDDEYETYEPWSPEREERETRRKAKREHRKRPKELAEAAATFTKP